MELKDRLLALMAQKKFTAEKLAEKSGVNRNTLNGWLYKDRIPRADEAIWLAGALGTTVEYLIEGRYSDSLDLPDDVTEIVEDLVRLDTDKQKCLAKMIHALVDDVPAQEPVPSPTRGPSPEFQPLKDGKSKEKKA